MADRVKFTILNGSQKGTEYIFNEADSLLVGRARDCHIRLPDEDRRVSRHHFMLELNPPEVRLRDLGSFYGTYVNAVKYGGRTREEGPNDARQRDFPAVELRDGDRVQAGDTLLVFNVEASVESSHDAASTVYCQNCGKDVTSEARTRRPGGYICKNCRRQMLADGALFDPGATLHGRTLGLPVPNYEIERKIGAGVSGTVYLARNQQNGLLAALKVIVLQISGHEHIIKQILRSLDAVRALHHAHLVDLFDCGARGNLFYLLLEYCDQGSLQALLAKRGGRIELHEAIPIMLQSLEGLAYAHQQHYVHRDLKPSSIMLSGDAASPVAKIADMGLANIFSRVGNAGSNPSTQFASALPFVPREQVLNYKVLTPANDVWSMGATFYTMLTGRLPRIQHENETEFEAVLRNEIVPIQEADESIPGDLAAVIDRALAAKPEDRYQDAGEMLAVLEKALDAG